MLRFKKIKLFLFPFLFSVLVFFVAKAQAPYEVSVVEFNASEFPRVQASLKIDGVEGGLLPKNLSLIENSKLNIGPMVLLPPHSTTTQIDLSLLIDSSFKTFSQQGLIRNNLKGLIHYFQEKKIDLRINFFTFDDSFELKNALPEEALSMIDQISFSQTDSPLIDGYTKIMDKSKSEFRPEAQKVMLIANGSAFEDIKDNGVTGMRMQEAIKAVSNHQDLTFIFGHPLQQIHGIRADNPLAEFSDFSHSVRGGYLGGFGTDLTSLGELLLRQSPEYFVLQYYSNHLPTAIEGSEAALQIDGTSVADFHYDVKPMPELIVHHLPENELAVGDLISLQVELENKGNAINAVELNYKNSEGALVALPFRHERANSGEGKLKYTLPLTESIFSKESLSYYISVHTPYTTTGNEIGMVTIPVNIYDPSIFLEAKLTEDKKAVLWTWSGPTVEKGKAFEVWMGDTLLETTDNTSYMIPLDACNRYQVLQIQVVFEDGTKSHPSRPFEFFADGILGHVPVQEREAVELMMKCLINKRIESYAQFVALTSEFSETLPLSLEKAGFYLSKILHENIWEKVKMGSNYFELILYIMKFLNKEQYLKYASPPSPVEKILLYKFITQANHRDDLNFDFDEAFSELSARVRGNLSL